MAGTYTHVYTASNGCDSTVNLTLAVNTNYTTNLNASTCQNAAYNLPWGGVAIAAGTYTHQYVSSMGCDSVVNINLSIRSTTTSNTTIIICSSQLPYVWNGNNYNASGTYTSILTGSNGCDSNAILQLTVNPTPPAPQVQSVQNLCQGSVTSPLTANGNYPLLWYTTPTGGVGNSAEPIPSTNQTGYTHYYVSQINGNCESPRAHIVVRVNRKPSIGSDRDIKICYGSSTSIANIYNTSGMNSQWYFNGVPVLNPTNINTAGNYQLFVSTTTGCKDTAVIRLLVQPQVVANAGPDDNAVFNQPYQLHGSGGLNYSWTPSMLLNNPNIANPTTTLTDETTFILTVKDEIGCSDTDTVTIKVFQGPTFYIPNAFTPNGDGLNDDFKPTYVGIQKLDYFRIFNRYGLLVFETYDMGKAWDGRYKGVNQPMGNYVYIVKGVDKNGKEKMLKGNVLLIH
jgi:gliding motility-associated-like protein